MKQWRIFLFFLGGGGHTGLAPPPPLQKKKRRKRSEKEGKREKKTGKGVGGWAPILGGWAPILEAGRSRVQGQSRGVGPDQGGIFIIFFDGIYIYFDQRRLRIDSRCAVLLSRAMEGIIRCRVLSDVFVLF